MCCLICRNRIGLCHLLKARHSKPTVVLVGQFPGQNLLCFLILEIILSDFRFRRIVKIPADLCYIMSLQHSKERRTAAHDTAGNKAAKEGHTEPFRVLRVNLALRVFIGHPVADVLAQLRQLFRKDSVYFVVPQTIRHVGEHFFRTFHAALHQGVDDPIHHAVLRHLQHIANLESADEQIQRQRFKQHLIEALTKSRCPCLIRGQTSLQRFGIRGIVRAAAKNRAAENRPGTRSPFRWHTKLGERGAKTAADHTDRCGICHAHSRLIEEVTNAAVMRTNSTAHRLCRCVFLRVKPRRDRIIHVRCHCMNRAAYALDQIVWNADDALKQTIFGCVRLRCKLVFDKLFKTIRKHGFVQILKVFVRFFRTTVTKDRVVLCAFLVGHKIGKRQEGIHLFRGNAHLAFALSTERSIRFVTVDVTAKGMTNPFTDICNIVRDLKVLRVQKCRPSVDE